MKASYDLFKLVSLFLNEQSESVTLPQQNGIFKSLLIGDIYLSIDDEGVFCVTYQGSDFYFSQEQTEEISARFLLIYNIRKNEKELKLIQRTEKRLRELVDNKKLIKEEKNING